MNAQPGSIALSPDGTYLVIGHYGNNTAPVQSINALTVLNLEQNTRQTFAVGHTPLAVAFGADGLALLDAAKILSDPRLLVDQKVED